MYRRCISFSLRSPRGERSQLPPFTLAIYRPKKLKRRLKPVFEAHIHRNSKPDRKNGTRIEVALEEGKFAACRALQPSALSECRKINSRWGIPPTRAIAGAKLQSNFLVAKRNP
jgi:hypothetical protein